MAENHIQPYAFEPRREIFEENSDSESSNDSEEMESDQNEMRAGNVSWCTCQQCRVMPTEQESICCQEMGELNQKLDGKNFNIFGQLFTNSVEYILFTNSVEYIVFTCIVICVIISYLDAQASCITSHQSFDVVCRHPDVLRTALVCMHDVRSDELHEPLENRC